MATAPRPPSPNTVVHGSGSKKQNRRSSGAASAAAAPAPAPGYFTAVRSKIRGLVGDTTAQAVQALVPVAEVVGVSGMASALSGYREAQGKNLKLGPVDLRGVAGLGFVAASLYGRKTGFCPHRLNIGTGFLTSLVHEKAFEFGSKFGTPDATAGIVSGDLDQAGLFGIALTKRAKEKKAERRLHRLEKREDKIENKIEKVKAKLGTPAAAPAPTVIARPAAAPGRVVTVPRGVRVYGPRGHILPAFAASYPVKAQRLREGWRLAMV